MKKLYYWSIANIGVDMRLFFSFIINFPRYIKEYLIVRKKYKGIVTMSPYLNDRKSGAGDFQHEYFIQDVFAAQWVHELNPVKVVDVGSRIDGYIGHLISFRKVELIDIRPMKSDTENLSFLQMNFSDSDSVREEYTDFVSCLHSIEHFGLGRYGDPIDLEAIPAAIRSFSKILKPNGSFMLSTTFGKERILFNKQWIFGWDAMKEMLNDNKLIIEQIYFLNKTKFIKADEQEIRKISDKQDTLVIILSRKIA